MGFTLQPATSDNFIDIEDILEEMLHTLTDKNLIMGFALVGAYPHKGGEWPLCLC